MKFISGNCYDEVGRFLGEWWKENTGHALYDVYSAIGVHDGNYVLGVAIFTDYTGSNIEIHVCMPKRISKVFIKYILNYIFNELNCNILRVKAHEDSPKSIDILYRLGFKHECDLEKYYGKNENAVMLKFNREQAKKWINLNECS